MKPHRTVDGHSVIMTELNLTSKCVVISIPLHSSTQLLQESQAGTQYAFNPCIKQFAHFILGFPLDSQKISNTNQILSTHSIKIVADNALLITDKNDSEERNQTNTI